MLLKEKVFIRSQEEFDSISDDYKGKIVIDSCNFKKPIIVDRYFEKPIQVINSYVRAKRNSFIVAFGNKTHISAKDSSFVYAFESVTVEAEDNCCVVASSNSEIRARDNSLVFAKNNVIVFAYDRSQISATGNVTVYNMQLLNGTIETKENARIVKKPETLKEIFDLYGILYDFKKAIFYKSVHKIDGEFISDYDRNFKYKIGSIVECPCDSDDTEFDSFGINICNLDAAFDYGKYWKDFAIIEVETDIDNIVFHKLNGCKVRTSKVKVIREIPLDECGIYGKILARKNVIQNNNCI